MSAQSIVCCSRAPTLTRARGGRLFLVGYWMIQACIAIGIALHYNVARDMLTQPVNRWIIGILETGTW